MKPESATSYCLERVRRHDHARYLTTLFSPPEQRELLWALYAWNLEVAKTAETVSEATLGEIRLQWWREGLEGLWQGNTRDHPVLEVLEGGRDRLARAAGSFERILDARSFDLDPQPPADLAELENYAEATASELLYIALTALGEPPSEQERQAARHVGIAWALTGLLRAVPFHARQKRLYLPEDHLSVAGVERSDLFELRGSDQISGVVMRLAERAGEHLEEARRHGGAIVRSRRAPLLLAGLNDLYLKALERAEYNPFAPSLARQEGKGVWKITWNAWRGRF